MDANRAADKQGLRIPAEYERVARVRDICGAAGAVPDVAVLGEQSGVPGGVV